MMEITKGTLIAILRDVDSSHVSAIAEVLLEHGINWVEVSLSEETKGLDCVRMLSRVRTQHSLGGGDGHIQPSRG